MLQFGHGTWWNSGRWALINAGHESDPQYLSSLHFRLPAQILQIHWSCIDLVSPYTLLKQLLISQYSPDLL